MAHKLGLVLLFGALTAFALPTVFADVGLSGQCYNEDASQGGQDELNVNDDMTVTALPNVLSGKGAVEAAVLFVTSSAMNGGTGKACKRYDCYTDCELNDQSYRYDYLEVHAGTTQVCYDAGVRLDGGCPHKPTGAGE